MRAIGIQILGVRTTCITAAACVLLFVSCHFPSVTRCCFAGTADTVIRDRVIAYVDDQAITMSELIDQFKNSAAISPDVTMSGVLNTMINRLLLLREAKKFRIEAATPEEVLREYIDLKIRAFIKVNDADVEQFYRENRNNFTGKEYDEVRDEIERYLTEKELNERLKDSLSMLKEKAYLKNYLDAE